MQMSDTAFDQFRINLAVREDVDDIQHEVLRHEMNATVNRHRLTGRQEGVHSFNTSQLASLVKMNGLWTRDHVLVTSLYLSALIDDENDIFYDAMDKGILPSAWTWVTWARGFRGTEAELLQHISTITNVRERCGAVCLATVTAPHAIGSQILCDFCLEPLAKVYHRLLQRALSQPNCHAIANRELGQLAKQLEVLFASNTDVTLATLIQASNLDHPESVIAPFQDAAGDYTARP
jgi:hypothetical protein